MRPSAWCALLLLASCTQPPPLGPAEERPAPAEPPPESPPHASPSLPPLTEIPPPQGFPPPQRAVPTFELEIASADLTKLNEDPSSDDFVPARIGLGGKVAPGRLRYRGSSTRRLPQKSFKIKLDPGYELEGRDKFELLASYLDSGKLTEKFAVDLFKALGLPVPEARYVRVSVNGRHNGLYLDMEHVGKDYLRAHDLEPTASVYRCGGRNCELKLPRRASYQQDFEKKTNELTPWDDLDELLRVLNRTDDAELERAIAERVALDLYLGNLAADALISNNIVEDEKGYWIHELGADRWSYVPWDLNNALMLFYRSRNPTSSPIVKRSPLVFTIYDPQIEPIYAKRHGENSAYQPTWNVLNTRAWDRPRLRERIVAFVERALAGPFAEEQAWPHIDALYATIEAELLADPYVDPTMARAAPGYLKQYVAGRRAHLLASLEELRRHGGGPLVINELGFGDGYVELYNRGDQALSLGGMTITTDLRQPFMQRLPSVTLAPRDHVRVGITLPLDGGEVGVFDGSRVYDPFDLVYFGPHASGTAYGRTSDGAEEWSALPQSPGGPNRP